MKRLVFILLFCAQSVLLYSFTPETDLKITKNSTVVNDVDVMCNVSLEFETLCDSTGYPTSKYDLDIHFSGAKPNVDYTIVVSSGLIVNPNVMDENMSGTIHIISIPNNQDVTVEISDNQFQCDIEEVVPGVSCGCDLSGASITDLYCNDSNEFVVKLEIEGSQYGILQGSLDSSTWTDIINLEYVISSPVNNPDTKLYLRSFDDTSCQTSLTFPQVTCPQVLIDPHINEFHYENTMSDFNEFIEIKHPSILSLADEDLYYINLYNGNSGNVYNSISLGQLPRYFDGEAYYYVWEPLGIGNGKQGIALCKLGNVIELISYEGTFTANNDCAAGTQSTDVGVDENNASPGSSIQLLDGVWTFIDGFNTKGVKNANLELFTSPKGQCVSNPIGVPMKGSSFIYFTANGKVIGSIDPNNSNIGLVYGSVYISDSPREDPDGTNYLNRSIYVSSEDTPNGQPLTLRLYFTQSELDSLIANSAGDGIDEVTSISDLIITRVDSDQCGSTYPGNGEVLIPSASGGDGLGLYLEVEVETLGGFFIHGGAAPLPVEMLGFDASKVKEGVQLNWTTASERNNSHFEIEKSLDGRNFNAIGTVNGNGTTSESKTYEYVDKNMNNTLLYYRLKQMDYDGAYAYSDVRSISINNGNVDFQIYPTVTEHTVSIVNNQGLSNTKVQVFNQLGQQITSKAIGQQCQIDLSEFAEGIYFINVTNEIGSTLLTQKVIKY